MQHRRPTLPVLALTCVCLAAACDLDTDLDTTQLRSAKSPTVEVFQYSTSQDLIANTNDPNNPILAPSPAGISPLEEPEISSGGLIAIKIRDQNDELVGFGTEQEVIDMVGASALTTYTLTLPGRGTLMLEQTEDFSPLFAEIYDMLDDAELVRSYDPPLAVLTTKPGTGRIVGGTGEFAHARGSWTELDIVNQFDLVARTFDIDCVLEVTFDKGEDDDDDDEDE
jgi:hypothetical protein